MEPSDFEELLRTQRMMAERVAQEQEIDLKIKLMNIINESVTGKKQIVQKEALIIEGQIQGLTEDQIERLLQELETDNFIIQQGSYVKKL